MLYNLDCQLCPLASTRYSVVAGTGPIPSKFMLVGEAPGDNEDRSGIPFVGQAGDELNYYLKLAEIENCYITNVVKCRPPKNRKPTTIEKATCRVYLDAEIEAVNPTVLILLGDIACQAFGISLSEHGIPQLREERWLVPMYHPAAGLYNRGLVPVIKADWQALQSRLARPVAPSFRLDDLIFVGGTLAIDTETTSIDASMADLVCASFASELAPLQPSVQREIPGWLAPFLRSSGVLKIFHNYKYEYKILKRLGFQVNNFYDTMLAAYVLGEERLGLKYLSRKYLNRQLNNAQSLLDEAQETLLSIWLHGAVSEASPPQSYEGLLLSPSKAGYLQSHHALREQLTLAKGAAPIATMRDVPEVKLFPYSAGDAVATQELYQILNPLLDKEGVRRIFDLEVALVPVLAEMELKGIKIDTGKLGSFKQGWNAEIETIQQKYPGVNLNASAQKAILLEAQGVEIEERTETGKRSTAKSILSKYSNNPIVSDLLRYSELSKLVTTYTTGIIENVDSRSRIHPEFNQVRGTSDEGEGATVTGRLSSRNPNFQNIPGRTEEGKKVRSCVIAEPGHTFVSFDYDQIEMLIMWFRAGEWKAVESYGRGEDAHTATAAFLYPQFHTEENPLCSQCERLRKAAKNVNFCVGYGGQEWKIAETAGISLEDALAMKERYFETFPRTAEYIRKTIALAHDAGYSTTLWGRKRWEPAIFSYDRIARGAAERELLNHTIQGTAADLIKQAMVNCYAGGYLPICQVHDELLFEWQTKDLDKNIPAVLHYMQCMDLGVPIRLHVKVGQNWGEMNDYRVL